MEEIRYTLMLSGIKKMADEMALFIEENNIEQEKSMSAPLHEKTPEEILKTVFGYESFRPLQKNVIDNVLLGRDTLAVMPTGGGKSICYEIPALIMNGLTLVVSPLIALMQDQVAQLEACSIEAAYLNSSLEWNEFRHICDRVQAGKIKILYVSPEGLNTAKIRNLISHQKIACITIDEAHCISEWGHDFRPDYMEIAAVRQMFPEAVCLALTATATKQVRDDIVKNLKMENPEILTSSFNRPNLFLQVTRKSSVPVDQIIAFIEAHNEMSGIVYCSSRKDVDAITKELCLRGIKALNYHAGLSADQRAKNQKAFISDKVNVMVATVAFGMGINKPDVRFVIHHSIPKSIEQYYQEIGRAGRDGLNSDILLLYSPSDIQKIRYFFDEVNDKAKAEKLLLGMTRYADSSTCRRKLLLSYFGETYSTETSEDYKCCDICCNTVSKAPAAVLIKHQGVKSFPKKTASADFNDSTSQELGTKLRVWRKKAADELGVPPYVIFGDKTLIDIANKRPRSSRELMNCYGIGESKAEKFGYYILRIVNN